MVVTGHAVVPNARRAGHLVELLEELVCAVDLRLLRATQFQRREGELGLGDEIDVLDGALLEGNRPVGVVVIERVGILKPRGSFVKTDTSWLMSRAAPKSRSTCESSRTYS